MSLAAGSQIGPYEIVGLIGAGGMGEVYRARDAKLHRHVAIKILPPAFASDPDRLARFEREAQVLASLNHPNIAAIYGFEERALVLELVDGPTLADRIAQGPIPIDETIPIARQIAEALEAAHEAGVIHRDLKPANIKLRADGTVKVLDFGLAKLVRDDASISSGASATLSPTITSPAAMTSVGVLLGTAAYMAPEQAKGRPADKRSDIWAFGCVLHEMLTARRTFAGEDVSDTLAAVLRGDPDWTFPAAVPPTLAALLRACLQKDRRRRPGDAAALLFALDHAFDIPGIVAPPPARRERWWTAGAIATALIVGAASAWALIRLLAVPTPDVIARFEVTAPPGMILPGANGIPRFAVSPDGQAVVFQAGPRPSGPYHLWLRRLDRLDAEPLRLTATPTENALQGLFWFADGRTIGFFDESAGKLKRVDVQTGAVQSIADVAGAQLSGSANDEDTILFASLQTKGILRVSAAGSTLVPLTTPEPSGGEQRHLWPRFLPDGRHFLYFVQTGAADGSSVHVGSLDDPQRTRLVASAAMAEFAPPDQLLYMRNDTLLAQRIDMKTFALLGEPVIVAQPVFATAQGRPGFAVSNTGVLVHSTGTGTATLAADSRALIWVDRAGHEQPVGVPPRGYASPRISPDGSRIAVSIQGQDEDIWVVDVARTTLTRVTFDRGRHAFPAWTPDSRRIVYAATLGGPASLFAIAADGTGTPERLTQSTSDQLPSSVSPDGAEVLFDSNTGDGGQMDLHAFTLSSRTARRLLAIPQPQRFGVISPDGRWIAYQSAESGANEIYVRPYPDVERGRSQVSTKGGTRPKWSKDGRELFYTVNTGTTTALMAVSVKPGTDWSAGLPTVLFSHRALAATYDVSPDGRRFLLNDAASPATAPISLQPVAEGPRLIVVVNWLKN